MAHLETKHTTHDGQELYLQAWVPDGFKAAVLIVHGLSEHSSRYSHFAQFLNRNGYAVYTFDGRGHGKSAVGPPTAFYKSIDDYATDVAELFKKMNAHANGKPCFIFGHSMGGCIVSYLEVTSSPRASGIILSGPAVAVNDDIPSILVKLSKLLSRVVPKLATTKVDSCSLSRDPSVVEQFRADPLVYSGGIRVRVGAEILRAINVISSRQADFKSPVFIVHGAGDLVVPSQGSQSLYDGVSSTDKTIKMYDELYHELINEPEKEIVMNDILNWMEARV